MKSKSLRFKLFALSGFLLLISIVVGGAGYYSNHKVSDEYKYITTINVPNVQYVGDMISHYRLARARLTELMLPGLAKEEGKKRIDAINEQWKNYDTKLQKYLAVPFSEGEEEIYKNYEVKMNDIRKRFDKILNMYSKNLSAPTYTQQEMSDVFIKEIGPLGDAVRESSGKLRDFHNNEIKRRTELADSTSRNGTILVVAFILLGSITGILFAIIFSNSLVKTLTEISAALSSASMQVSSGSTQIASTSQELSQATTEQSASLEQTAASIEEMNSMVQKNAENAKKTYTVAINSKESAEVGQNAVKDMINSIKEINESNQNIMQSIDESNLKMEEIAKVIADIGIKTKVINDIVFQTKLLSFNASVEAARAGEQGKGFAVVAEEVGNLAEMSGNAAREISQMLDSSITKVNDIVKTTKSQIEVLVADGKIKVEAGTTVAHRCGSILDSIVENVESVNKLALEISTASDEQAKGIQEISKAASMLESVTHQNSTASEESASAAEALSTQAYSLNQIVAQLVTTINGGNTH